MALLSPAEYQRMHDKWPPILDSRRQELAAMPWWRLLARRALRKSIADGVHSKELCNLFKARAEREI